MSVTSMFDNSIKRSVQNEPFFQVWVPIVLVRGPTMSNFKSHRKLFHNFLLQFWCANRWQLPITYFFFLLTLYYMTYIIIVTKKLCNNLWYSIIFLVNYFIHRFMDGVLKCHTNETFIYLVKNTTNNEKWKHVKGNSKLSSTRIEF